eukprot:scaffold286_cov247-Pinguiococcus_pyrenoidosus.AAC.12
MRSSNVLPFLATNCAVLSATARMSGGGMMMPTTLPCVAFSLSAMRSTSALILGGRSARQDAGGEWRASAGKMAPKHAQRGRERGDRTARQLKKRIQLDQI